MSLNGSAVLEPWVLAPDESIICKGLFAGGPGPQIPSTVCDGPYVSTACIPRCSHQMKHRTALRGQRVGRVSKAGSLCVSAEAML